MIKLGKFLFNTILEYFVVSITFFTLTAQILVRSLANFYRQKEFIIYMIRQRAKADNLAICYRKKQMDVNFSCVCPVIDNEFGHNIVKVVCSSIRLSFRGSTATLTML